MSRISPEIIAGTPTCGIRGVEWYETVGGWLARVVERGAEWLLFVNETESGWSSCVRSNGRELELNCLPDLGTAISAAIERVKGFASAGDLTTSRQLDSVKLSVDDILSDVAECRETSAALDVIPCICCSRPFRSRGAHNRVCQPCRATAPKF